jgi:hypothetical protein
VSKIGDEDSKNTLYCSFCGKSQHEVRKLIAGPTVFVCDECVELCKDIIHEENKPSQVNSRDGGASSYTLSVTEETPAFWATRVQFVATCPSEAVSTILLGGDFLALLDATTGLRRRGNSISARVAGLRVGCRRAHPETADRCHGTARAPWSVAPCDNSSSYATFRGAEGNYP